MARPASICSLNIALEAVRGLVGVDLRCDGKVVGELTAYDVEAAALRPPCAKALRGLSRAVGVQLVPYVVHYSKIPAHLRGTGVGTAMYLAATEGASRLGGALIQHQCFYDPELEGGPGSTSRLARNVWEGGRFGMRTRIYGGSVAYMPRANWGSGDDMLDFGQLELGETRVA